MTTEISIKLKESLTTKQAEEIIKIFWAYLQKKKIKSNTNSIHYLIKEETRKR